MGMEDKDIRNKKKEQLGMNHGTAANKLRKMVLFALIKQAALDNCYRCGGVIENVEDLSIEHKVPWLDSDDPVKLYFDLNNITFSHLKCNSRENRGKFIKGQNAKEYPEIIGPDGTVYPAGKNLKKFCEEHNPSRGRMYEVIHDPTSRRKSHHGFRIK